MSIIIVWFPHPVPPVLHPRRKRPRKRIPCLCTPVITWLASNLDHGKLPAEERVCSSFWPLPLPPARRRTFHNCEKLRRNRFLVEHLNVILSHKIA
ncbi:hypothetical protein AVEN_259864-1 [Araneus ventricosus]|uniref:Uncharacterized protein n=1 Tax=Araneus ventricosus TaxID=182803 RepID=A0A4Y2DR32_ARAVE|nr:hypothetical protein AVEN_259864-1 [Araneus ventricosus]